MQALEAVMRARELLQTLTPLRRDCGGVCGAACCAPDEDGQGGMLLFPGEEALYRPLPQGFSLRQDDSVTPGMLLLTCGSICSYHRISRSAALTLRRRTEKVSRR